MPFDRRLFGIVGWCDESNGEWVVTIRARLQQRPCGCLLAQGIPGLFAAGKGSANRRQTTTMLNVFGAIRTMMIEFTRWPEEFAARYRQKVTGGICR